MKRKSLRILQSITDRQDASLGLYFKEVSKQPMLTPEEEMNLTSRIKNGDEEAVQKLVKANLRFVISIAKQYQNKGLSLVDLVQEGNLGLLESIRRYDNSKGVRFISYAVWWIRQAITHAISEYCRIVRIPFSQIICLNRVAKASDTFMHINGRTASVEELSKATNIDKDKIQFALDSNNRSVSLESPFKDEEAGCLLDIIPNINSKEANDDLEESEISENLNKVLDKLTNRERDIVRMSFGIGMEPMQNEEIASRFGIGYERVRQLVKEIVVKLRNNYSDELKELL